MENPYPPGKIDSQLTNDFADFFESKILAIRERFKDVQPYQLSVRDVPKLSRFAPMMESEVEQTTLLKFIWSNKMKKILCPLILINMILKYVAK